MKSVELTLPGEASYDQACAFASEVYAKELGVHLSHFPEALFTIADGTRVVGCIGLNLSLHSPLFAQDARLSVLRQADPHLAYCEQSILALRHFSIGLPILISVAARYAQINHKDRVVYAAIGVSQKTIRHLGFETQEYGKVDLSLLPDEVRPQYEFWQQTFDPVCCFLKTQRAGMIYSTLLQRLGGKVMLAPRLQAILSDSERKAA